MSKFEGASNDSRAGSAPPTKFARACTRCRQQKLACKPGNNGTYPCARCEDSGAQCVLVEKQRPTPIPTLSSKLSRQEASLSDLADQLQSIQAHLMSLADLPARMGLLEQRYNNLLIQSSSSASGSTPPLVSQLHKYPQQGSSFDHILANSNNGPLKPPSTSSYGPSPSPIHQTSSLRDVNPVQSFRDGEDPGQGKERDTEQESAIVVHDFENADMNTTRILSDVRVYHRRSSSRPAKRKRIEDEKDAFDVAFRIFVINCLPAVNFLDPAEPDFNPTAIKALSPLLYWAVIAVGARETPELNDLFITSQENTMELLRQTLGGPKPTYWDLVGAMVWNKWLAPVRPIGHVVDMAYELDIHRTYELLRDKSRPSPEDVKKIRIWISICIQDYFLSVATGRPPHYPHRSIILEQARWIVSLPETKRNDYRLLATYEYEEIAHSIQVELIRTGILSEDWESEVNTRIAAIDEWYARWEPIAISKSGPDELCSMLKSLQINWHLAKLSVYSVVLRGVRTTEDLTPQRLRYVGRSVDAARAECQLCIRDFQGPAIQYLGETQLYAFVSASVFLLKVIWLLPSSYDTAAIFADVEAVIATFKAVSGQLLAHFLAQILKHVRHHFQESQLRIPTLMPAVNEYSVKTGHKTNLPFNPFEVDGSVGLSGNREGLTDGEGMINGIPPPDVFGEPENDFWSWLQSEGQSFSPLVNTLDTFDSSIGLGGL